MPGSQKSFSNYSMQNSHLEGLLEQIARFLPLILIRQFWGQPRKLDSNRLPLRRQLSSAVLQPGRALGQYLYRLWIQSQVVIMLQAFHIFQLNIFLIFNKFYFLSSLITPTAAYRLPELFVCGLRDCCRCKQSNLMGWRSFLLNGPPSSRDRVIEKLRRKGHSLYFKDEKRLRFSGLHEVPESVSRKNSFPWSPAQVPLPVSLSPLREDALEGKNPI